MNHNNMYNILNKLNALNPETPKPAEQAKPKTKLQESIDTISEKYMGFKKTVAAIKKGGSAENPEAVAAAIGRKKYGKEKFQKAAAAGKKLGEAAKPDYIDLDKDGNKTEPMKKAAKDAKKARVTEMDKSQPSSDRGGESSGNPYAKGSKATPAKAKDVAKSAGKALNKAMDKAHKKQVEEVAPPGAKAERMVKHIKKGYAKDGKLTPKEKGIAYATAWKAHNKGKLDETIRAMFEAGFTKEQIVEGWEEMLKSVKKRGEEEKGTGKFNKEKTDKGTKYTRKYDAKSGESEETGKDGEGKEAKRKRGRPRKNTMENFSTAKKMIAEHFGSMIEGSIQGGVWTAGKGNVPVPQNPEVAKPTPKAAPAATGNAVTGKAAQDMMKSSDPNIYNKLKGFDTPANPTKAVVDPEGVKEDDMEEGNAFGAAIAKAKADGIQKGETVKVGGKEYPVKENADLDAMLKLAGLKESQLDECGMSAMGNGMMGADQEGKMNISTNMSSDGTKTVTISADGNAATELMQMLKLAGLGSGEQQAVVVAQDDDEEVEENMAVQAVPEEEEEVDEAKDSRYEASTTPDEHVMPVQSQTKGGDGDVAGQEKKMRPEGYKFSDNPAAMSESMSLKLIKEYEGIKVKK